MWELLILSKLKWEVLTVTPHDFVRPLMRRIPIDETDVDSRVLLSHTHTFIALCARGELIDFEAKKDVHLSFCVYHVIRDENFLAHTCYFFSRALFCHLLPRSVKINRCLIGL